MKISHAVFSVILLTWLCYLVFSPDRGLPYSATEKEDLCAQSLNASDQQQLSDYITLDHPFLWKKFWHENYSLAQAAPYLFAEKAAKKNAQWMLNWLSDHDIDPICLDRKELHELIVKLIKVESNSLHLDFVKENDEAGVRLGLNKADLKELNKRLFFEVLIEKTLEEIHTQLA